MVIDDNAIHLDLTAPVLGRFRNGGSTAMSDVTKRGLVAGPIPEPREFEETLPVTAIGH